jgi:hypothetical protein
MRDTLQTSREIALEYVRWFVNRRAFTLQSDRPHPDTGRHYYYRPRSRDDRSGITVWDIQRHLSGQMTLGLYAINPATQRVKWMAIDADYRRAVEDLLRLQYELGQTGIQAALEQSRRGGHLWIFFEQPVLARHARIFVNHLADKLNVNVKGSGGIDGIELFPKQDHLDAGQFGNAIRGPLGIHRAAGRRYWFYGAPYDLGSQMAYLCGLRRVSERQLLQLTADVPNVPDVQPTPVNRAFDPNRPHFRILDFVHPERKVGRNWITQCPSCAAAGRDRSKDNLAISVEEPLKYRCWSGCTREQIRQALGVATPAVA